MSYPKVVALDTDWTIWEQFLDPERWGKGPGAYEKVEDNIERVDRWLLRDRTNHDNWIRVYNDISNVVNDILKNGAKLAIVSRNPSKDMCDRALYYFNTINPSDGKEWSIIHLVQYDEVVDHSKVGHFRRIQTWSQSDFLDMLLFDDEAFNNIVKVELGTTFQLIRNGKGLVWDTYQQGLDAWRRAQNVRIPSDPSFVANPVLIGYSGLPTSWINLVGRGEGTVDTSVPARWGYGLYVADTIALAQYFTRWNNDWNSEKSYVCEVWVKDYDTWAKINKIWVPEHSSNVPQMDNMHWSDQQSGRSQEDRDRTIAENWHVYTPYVLFSRHHWMEGMPIPRNQRWNEMVVYTQVQRSLFKVIQLSDDQVAQNTNPSPYPIQDQIKEWNITVTSEARDEFLRYGEKDLHQLSA